MSAYSKIASHFKNKYAASTNYANQTQILSDATDVLCAIIGIKPSELGMWQGSFNPHDAAASAGYHRKANCADYVLPTQVSHDEFVRTASYIGIFGWVRDDTAAGGRMEPTHFHCFAGFYTAKASVTAGIISQQFDYVHGGSGLVTGKDRHAAIRPDLRGVQFLEKAPSRNAVVTVATHSYTQPGKALKHQDAARAKGFALTNCAGIVRVWKLDPAGNKINGSSVKMIVTDGLRFYDAKKVAFR